MRVIWATVSSRCPSKIGGREISVETEFSMIEILELTIEYLMFHLDCHRWNLLLLRRRLAVGSPESNGGSVRLLIIEDHPPDARLDLGSLDLFAL